MPALRPSLAPYVVAAVLVLTGLPSGTAAPALAGVPDHPADIAAAVVLLPRPCRTRDLDAAPGSLFEPIGVLRAIRVVLRNVSGSACWAGGTPVVEVRGADGARLDFRQRRLGAAPRHVVIEPGHGATVVLGANRCDVRTLAEARGVGLRLTATGATWEVRLPSSRPDGFALCAGEGADRHVLVSAVTTDARPDLPKPEAPPEDVAQLYDDPSRPLPGPAAASRGTTYGRADLDGDGVDDVVVVRATGLVTAHVSGLGTRVVGTSAGPGFRLRALTSLVGGDRADVLVGGGFADGPGSRTSWLRVRHGRLGFVHDADGEPLSVALAPGSGHGHAGVTCGQGSMVLHEAVMRLAPRADGPRYDLTSSTVAAHGFRAVVVARTGHRLDPAEVDPARVVRCPGLDRDGDPTIPPPWRRSVTLLPRACGAADLDLTAGRLRYSMGGPYDADLRLTNDSSGPCWVGGSTTAALLDRSGEVIPFAIDRPFEDFRPTHAVLAPGHAARVGLFTSHCQGAVRGVASSVRLRVPAIDDFLEARLPRPSDSGTVAFALCGWGRTRTSISTGTITAPIDAIFEDVPAPVAVELHDGLRARVDSTPVATYGRADLDGDDRADLVVVRPGGYVVAHLSTYGIEVVRVRTEYGLRLRALPHLTDRSRADVLVSGVPATGAELSSSDTWLRVTRSGRLGVVRYRNGAPARLSFAQGAGDVYQAVRCGPRRVETVTGVLGGGRSVLRTTTLRVRGLRASHVSAEQARVDDSAVVAAGATRCVGLDRHGHAD